MGIPVLFAMGKRYYLAAYVMVKVFIFVRIARVAVASVTAVTILTDIIIITAIMLVMTPIHRINFPVLYVKEKKRFLCHVLIPIVTMARFIAKSVIILEE